MNAVASMYDLTGRAGPFGIALMDTARGNPLLCPAAFTASLPVGLTGGAAHGPLRATPASSSSSSFSSSSSATTSSSSSAPSATPAPHHLPTAASSAKRTGFSIEDILCHSSGEQQQHPHQQRKQLSTNGARTGAGSGAGPLGPGGEIAPKHGADEEAAAAAAAAAAAKCVFSTRLMQTSAARAFFRLNDPLRHHFTPGPYHHPHPHHHHHHHHQSAGGGYGATPGHAALSPAALSVPVPVPVYLRGKSPAGGPHDASSAAAAAAAAVGGGPRSAKKCRRSRTVFTELQLMGLEKRFERQKYLSTPDRLELADTLGLSQLQVKTWYQNRRMKWKKQVLQGGSQEAPTKPKGRPKKSDFQDAVTSPPASPPASPASSCFSQSSSEPAHAHAHTPDDAGSPFAVAS